MSATRITLPYPPTLNNAFVTSRQGTRHRSARYQKWMTAALWEIKAARIGSYDVPVRLSIIIRPPDYRKRDIDNLIKPLCDCLVKARVIPDDSSEFVRGIAAEWDLPPGNPIAVLEISRA